MSRPSRPSPVDRAVERAFHRTCGGLQLPILRLHEIYTAGRSAYAAGEDVDAAVLACARRIAEPPPATSR